MNKENINPIIIIPSRLSATRLPNKPLLNINGLPMIIQVLKRAQEADFADILVATADKEIADCVKDYKGKAILTTPSLPSGSDRIYEAINNFDANGKYNTIINLQGDLPTIEKSCIQSCFDLIKLHNYSMSTIAAKIDNDNDKINSNVVKAIVSFKDDNHHIGEALYFSRATAPWGEGELYHHIGIYGYRREALKKFTMLPPSHLEKRERLEQLRALENNMKIGVAIVETIPIGVDTYEDLVKATNFIKQHCPNS